MLACSWNEALANCQLRIFWATSVESSRRSRVHEHLCISLRALWVPPLTRTFSKRCQLIFFFTCITIRNITTYIHEEIMRFWIYLKLSQKSAQRTQNSNIDFQKRIKFFYAHKQEESREEQFFEMFSHVESDLFRDLDRLHPPTWENLRLWKTVVDSLQWF